MALRDERDYEQRRQQIIDGALTVFSQKGFEKATNKDIAEAAGIGSPGLIYHYFQDKANLLQQVIEQRAPLLRLVAQPDAFMSKPPREALTLFAHTLLQVLDNPPAVALLKLLVGEVSRNPTVAQMMNRIGPGRAVPLMSRYLEQQMDAGILRRTDPAAATRCFIGPLVAYIITRELFQQADAQALSPAAMADTTVDIFLRGMEPDTESTPTDHGHSTHEASIARNGSH